MIDIARVNAFLTWQLAQGQDPAASRDANRKFLISLIADLISGKWQDAPSCESIIYSDMNQPRSQNPSPSKSASASVSTTTTSPRMVASCTAVASIQAFPKTRKKRMCVVCRFEDRNPTQATDFCTRHNVCLCKRIYPKEPLAFGYDRPDWTCWEKFHEYYLPSGLFSSRGNVNRSSPLYKQKAAATELATVVPESTVEATQGPDGVDAASPIAAVTPGATNTVRSLSFESFTSMLTSTPSFDFSSAL